MQDLQIITDLVVILAVSIPIIFLFKKLNIPSIVGFLFAGIIIGPFGFQLIADTKDIEVMAEIGVMLLLFSIGLEVSITNLIKIRKLLLISGGLQVLLTAAASAFIFIFLGVQISHAIFFGMLISLSSTAIVLKLLSDKNELEAPHGKIALAVLIFQDLAIVPMIISLPILGSKTELSFWGITLQLLYAFGSVAVILILAKILMPKIMYQVARLKLKEVFTIGILLLLIGTAYLTHALGLSFALGAFIAGLILSDSEFSSQVAADTLPLKDTFNSIFFVSIGLLLNIQFVMTNPIAVLTLVLGIILLKTIVVIVIVKILRYPIRIAVMTGICLAQIGEFSFVLAQAGMGYGLMTHDFYNAFLAASIFTMILTPFLFKLAPILGSTAVEINPFAKNTPKAALNNHVIIVGFGLNGKNLARVLKETGISYLVIELDPETVKEARENGENVLFGDITKEEILHKAAIGKANAIVYAISDPRSTKLGLKLAKSINPDIYSVIRTRYTAEIDELLRFGADAVIPEEFETSLQIFSKVLERFHIPINVIMQQVAILRGESYSLMVKENSDVNSFQKINEILAAGLTETYFVSEASPIVNKTLSAINLRAETDATVIAIVRKDNTISNPSGKEPLLANDTLVITGSHEAVDKAINLLSRCK
jgi:monovalent cation:H+ antiporter-2, CPA2 family